jgi:hypothetical protein
MYTQFWSGSLNEGAHMEDIKINFREIGCENVDRIHLAQDVFNFFITPEVHSS